MACSATKDQEEEYVLTERDDIKDKFDVNSHSGSSFAILKSKKTGQLVVRKSVCISCTPETCEGRFYCDHYKLYSESVIVSSLDHPNVVKFVKLLQKPMIIELYLEYIPGVNLFDELVEVGPMPHTRARHIFRQIAEGLHYIHKSGVAHRDIKLENVMISRDGLDTVKIIDFGLSTLCTKREMLHLMCGSLEYCSPSLLRSEPYLGHANDWWACGVILYGLITDHFPWPLNEKKTAKTVLHAAQGIYYPLDKEKYSKAVRALIKGLLEVKQWERWGYREIQACSWFKGLASHRSCKKAGPKDDSEDPKIRFSESNIDSPRTSQSSIELPEE